MANKVYLYQDIYLYPGTYDRYTNLSKLYGKSGIYFEAKGDYSSDIGGYEYITKGPYNYTDTMYVPSSYTEMDTTYWVDMELESSMEFSSCYLSGYDKNGNYMASYFYEGTKVSIYCLEEDPSEEPPDLEQLSLVGSYYLSAEETYLYGPTHNDMEEGATYYITFTAEGGVENSFYLKPFVYHEMEGEDYYPGVYPIRFDFGDGYIRCEVSGDYGLVELYKLESNDPEDPETPSASVTASITLNATTGIATWSYSASSSDISFYEPYVQLWDLNDQIIDPIQIADSSYDFSSYMTSGQTYYATLRVGYYDYNNGTSDEVTARSQEVIYSPSSPDPEEPEDPTPSTLIYATYSYYDSSIEDYTNFTVHDVSLSNLNSIMDNYGGELVTPANGDLTGWWFDLGDGNRGKIKVDFADMDGDGIATDLTSYSVTLPSGDKFSGGPYSSEGREGWYPITSSTQNKDWGDWTVSIYEDTKKTSSFSAHMIAIREAICSKASIPSNPMAINAMITTLNGLNTTGSSVDISNYNDKDFNVCVSMLANVIRAKTNTTTKLKLEQMPSAIASIVLAPKYIDCPIELKSDGSYVITLPGAGTIQGTFQRYVDGNLRDSWSVDAYSSSGTYSDTTSIEYEAATYLTFEGQFSFYDQYGSWDLIKGESNIVTKGYATYSAECLNCSNILEWTEQQVNRYITCYNCNNEFIAREGYLERGGEEGETYGVCHVSLEYQGDYCNYEGPYDLGCPTHGFANWTTRDY